MNAQSQPRNTPALRRRHPFGMLLRREYWEHRGGFLWAPVIAGGISLLLTIVFSIIAVVVARRAAAEGELQIDGMVVNGLDLALLTSRMSASDLQQLADAIDLSLVMSSSWPFIVMAFVVFFYCLGALYDDRKDRSLLFWKSLPVSDRDTVLSKVASALLVAPLLATAAALVTMFAHLVVVSVLVMSHGGSAWQLLWASGTPFRLTLFFIAAIPVYAAWALPTVGWLLMCSAWARSKPFLWALLIPVLLGVCVSAFSVMEYFGQTTGWFWQNVVARMLLSVVPAGWMDAINLGALAESSEGMRHLTSLPTLYSTFASPKMWIGMLAGAAMIAISVRLRRWREEG
ncbi:ABC-2 transporter permease [Luteimonas abyssi]|uniref:ABC-2 transporter permease n=1 Tax=Luteimonas abyssi TaxID=1247514 RepID=UPI000737B27A|nr:ABC-2 transporter permease [Luteimonas abyssi]